MASMRTLAPLALAGLSIAAVTRLLRETRKISFAGKAALITGGSRGLGLVIARKLADEGARVAIMGRDATALDLAGQDLARRGVEVLTIRGDVGTREDAEAAVAQVVRGFGRIDLLVNNAGQIQVGPLDHMELEDFEAALATHFWGPLYTTLAATPHMRRQGGGRVVNIASLGGLVAVPHLTPYSASKFALVGLSDGLRAELARDNILVSTVCPGLMRTGSHLNAFFKGQHKAEFTLFSIVNALPPFSVSAERAATAIVEAARYGDPQLTISGMARIAQLSNAIVPGVTGNLMALTNWALPRPTGPEGDRIRTGWESQTALSPSIVTRLADRATAANNELAPSTADPASIAPAIEDLRDLDEAKEATR